MTAFNSTARLRLLACTAGLCALANAHAQHGVMRLPPIGDTRDCALLKPAPNMGHSNRSCEQTRHSYLQGHLHGNFLPPQCPADKPLRGMTNISCTDRYNARGELGAAYHSTLCCGYARQSPVYLPNVVPSAPAAAGPTFRAKIPVGANSPGDAPCTRPGSAYTRATMRESTYLTRVRAGLDQQCRGHGSQQGIFSNAIFSACTAGTPDGRISYFVEIDVTCAP
jgi:hypothetical protein